MVLKEYDYNTGVDMKEILGYLEAGHSQLGNLSEAIELFREILKIWEQDPNAKLVLGYTSNMISSGMREVIKYLCEKKMVDAVVTSCGGIEEDFIKCQNHFFRGKFFNDDLMLRMNGINRTGNMFVPNKNYIDFEEFFLPIVKKMERQIWKENKVFTSSMVITEMAKKIKNEESIYY